MDWNAMASSSMASTVTVPRCVRSYLRCQRHRSTCTRSRPRPLTRSGVSGRRNRRRCCGPRSRSASLVTRSRPSSSKATRSRTAARRSRASSPARSTSRMFKPGGTAPNRRRTCRNTNPNAHQRPEHPDHQYRNRRNTLRLPTRPHQKTPAPRNQTRTKKRNTPTRRNAQKLQIQKVNKVPGQGLTVSRSLTSSGDSVLVQDIGDTSFKSSATLSDS